MQPGPDPSETASGNEVPYEVLKKRNAILKGAVVRLQSSNQEWEVKTKNLQDRNQLLQDDLAKCRSELQSARYNTERLERRCNALMTELQESKEAAKAGKGLFGGVFTSSGKDEQLLALKEELEVVKEELENKIRENESVHMSLFENKQQSENTARALQKKLKACEDGLKEQQGQVRELEGALKKSEGEEARLVNVTLDLRQQLLVAKDIEAHHETLISQVKYYADLVQRQGVLDDRRNLAFTKLTINSSDRRLNRKRFLVMEDAFMVLNSIVTEVQGIFGNISERTHGLIKQIIEASGSSIDEGMCSGASLPDGYQQFAQLRDSLRDANSQITTSASTMVSCFNSLLESKRSDLSHMVHDPILDATDAKHDPDKPHLIGSLTAFLGFVGDSLSLIPRALSMAPISAASHPEPLTPISPTSSDPYRDVLTNIDEVTIAVAALVAALSDPRLVPNEMRLMEAAIAKERSQSEERRRPSPLGWMGSTLEQASQGVPFLLGELHSKWNSFAQSLAQLTTKVYHDSQVPPTAKLIDSRINQSCKIILKSLKGLATKYNAWQILEWEASVGCPTSSSDATTAPSTNNQGLSILPPMKDCTTDQLDLLPPAYHTSTSIYHNIEDAKDAMRGKVKAFMAKANAMGLVAGFGSKGRELSVTPMKSSPSNENVLQRPDAKDFSIKTHGSPKDGLQDMDWDNSPVELQTPVGLSNMTRLDSGTAFESFKQQKHKRMQLEADLHSTLFDPLDIPLDAGTATPTLLAQKVMQLHGVCLKASGPLNLADSLPVGMSTVDEDYDHWDQQRDYYQSLIHMADTKAVEYCMEYQKAVLEVEDKYNTILEMQNTIATKDKQVEALKDEMDSLRLNYEEQIQILSNHLSELNDTVARSTEKKGK